MSTASEELHATVADRLRQITQRYTGRRQALVDVLLAAARPVTIPEILADGRGLPQSSAYRNLAVLEQAGVVRRVQADGDFARYELAEELTEHHHHLVCTECGDVADFTLSPRAEAAVSRALADAVKSHRFETDAHRLDVLGRCARCSTGGD